MNCDYPTTKYDIYGTFPANCQNKAEYEKNGLNICKEHYRYILSINLKQKMEWRKIRKKPEGKKED